MQEEIRREAVLRGRPPRFVAAVPVGHEYSRVDHSGVGEARNGRGEGGGSVAVESAGPGQGAEFTVRLPIWEVATDRAVAQSASRAPTARRVLVIEDNIDAAESLREVLEFGGHVVEIANSGRDGIERSLTFRPDMILCDIGLPGMDGYDVARRLRADKTLASTYLVALTGYALPEDLARAKEAGFDEHIAKPASLERIEEVLANSPR